MYKEKDNNDNTEKYLFETEKLDNIPSELILLIYEK